MKSVIPVSLAAEPPLARSIFNSLAQAGLEHNCIFGGAPRDADYAARHQVERPIKDYDIRLWLPEQDFNAYSAMALMELERAFGPMTPTPALGTGQMRYIFNLQGNELDVSLRPVPARWQNREIPVAAVAQDRAADADIGLCSVAIAPDLQAWGTPEYVADRTNKTLSVYPIADAERKAAYTTRMAAKFPTHRLIEL